MAVFKCKMCGGDLPNIAEGNVVEVASETQPERGSDVYLCVKAPVQYVCDRARR